jgi:hypothetical protein
VSVLSNPPDSLILFSFFDRGVVIASAAADRFLAAGEHNIKNSKKLAPGICSLSHGVMVSTSDCPFLQTISASQRQPVTLPSRKL